MLYLEKIRQEEAFSDNWPLKKEKKSIPVSDIYLQLKIKNMMKYLMAISNEAIQSETEESYLKNCRSRVFVFSYISEEFYSGHMVIK